VPPLGIDRHQFRIWTRIELTGDFKLTRIDDVHDVAVPCGYVDLLSVRTGDDAARTAGRGNRLDDLESLAVDHRDGVVLFVGDEDCVG